MKLLRDLRFLVRLQLPLTVVALLLQIAAVMKVLQVHCVVRVGQFALVQLRFVTVPILRSSSNFAEEDVKHSELQGRS